MAFEVNHFDTIELQLAPPGKRLGKAVLILARWSKKPACRLAIFVHGFGKGTDTWSRFEQLLPQEQEAVSTDICFFQYDALFNQTSASASLFQGLLERFLVDPHHLINKSVDRNIRDPFQYQRIVIAGHSTGANVTRLALIEGFKGLRRQAFQNAPIRMVLYAPAHRGAIAADLAVGAFTKTNWILNLVGIGVRYSSPLIEELRPKSHVLIELMNETTNLLKQNGPKQLLVAHDLLRAQNERVVYDLRFCADPWHPNTLLVGEDHFSICKPTTSTEPKYQRLKAALFED